jgi:hypothetical protein
MRLIVYTLLTGVVALVAMGGLAFYLGYSAGLGRAPHNADLRPIIEEIRSIASKMKSGQPVAGQGDVKEKLALVTQELTETAAKYDTCSRKLSVMRVKLETNGNTDQKPDDGAHRVASVDPNKEPILKDDVLLRYNKSKTYKDVDVTLRLSAVTSRAARLVMNQQSLAIAYGERKIIRHRENICELELTETNVASRRARLRISCKRQ